MSGDPGGLSTTENVETPILPAELFYPICNYVSSRYDLSKLATTSRILQRPAESVLHHKVVVDSRHVGRVFVQTFKRCPRFAPLVRELELERNPVPREPEDDGYWQDMRNVIGSLSALESLTIEDGRDQPLSWVISSLPLNRLRVLRCAFIMDVDFFGVLRRQNSLEELVWKGGLVALPSSTSVKTVNTAQQTEENPHAPNSETTSPDLDESLIPIIQQYLPSSSLPNLRYLISESLALARMLIPGRAVTHLWVPGSIFTAVVSSSMVYPHITSAPASTAPMSPSGHLIQLAVPHLELSSSQRLERVCRATRDFALGREPVLSLRMALDLGRSELRSALDCIAHNLPELRCLGFVPGHFFDQPDGSSTSKLADEELVNPLPSFKHLHTLCLWSIPTRKAVACLQNAPGLPALRTLACLHYSAAFEWLCLPIKDGDSDSSNAYKGGIEWSHEARLGDGLGNRRRRVTPAHDPRNLLWRDV